MKLFTFFVLQYRHRSYYSCLDNNEYVLRIPGLWCIIWFNGYTHDVEDKSFKLI